VKNADSQLIGFFGGWFHQDWDLEAASPDEILENYLTQADRAERAALSAAIRNYVEMCPDDHLLRDRLFQDLQCYYDPSRDGVSPRAWLLSIVERLQTG